MSNARPPVPDTEEGRQAALAEAREQGRALGSYWLTWLRKNWGGVWTEQQAEMADRADRIGWGAQLKAAQSAAEAEILRAAVPDGVLADRPERLTPEYEPE